MPLYSAYGLNIDAALPLPELVPNDGNDLDRADVIVRFGKIDSIPFQTNGVARRIHATAHEIYLYWQGIGLFLVRNGQEIIIDPVPGVEEYVLRQFILGTALAMVLHQQGETAVLHASVVALSGQAVAFVGVKGAGKSTLAATLQARGHDLVADDILVVDISQKHPYALPGSPHLKLWPDSIAALGHAPEQLPRIRPELEKRRYRLRTDFSRTPVPLKRIYVLGLGSEIKTTSLSPQDALITLMPHWYGARFGLDLLNALGISIHFLQCAKLARCTSVYRLERPHSLAGLPSAAQLVEQQLTVDTRQIEMKTINSAMG